MNGPLYRSFLVRLWRESEECSAWRGEIEHIQTGTVVEVSSLEEALALIRRIVSENNEPPAPTFSTSVSLS